MGGKYGDLRIGEIEEILKAEGLDWPCFACDEAGRGPLAGPVTGACVLFEKDFIFPEKLNDSKRLSASRREELAKEIQSRALAWAVVDVDGARIDEINILEASLEAMRKCVELVRVKASIEPRLVLVDGNQLLKSCPYPQRCYVKGDARSFQIAGASVLAKVHRDALMMEMDALYPEYGFAVHKGYPTKMHLEAIAKNGPCPIHRLSYKPLAAYRDFRR